MEEVKNEKFFLFLKNMRKKALFLKNTFFRNILPSRIFFALSHFILKWSNNKRI